MPCAASPRSSTPCRLGRVEGVYNGFQHKQCAAGARHSTSSAACSRGQHRSTSGRPHSTCDGPGWDGFHMCVHAQQCCQAAQCTGGEHLPSWRAPLAAAAAGVQLARVHMRAASQHSQLSRRGWSSAAHLGAMQLGEDRPVADGVENRPLPHQGLGRLPDAGGQAGQVPGVSQRLKHPSRIASPAGRDSWCCAPAWLAAGLEQRVCNARAEHPTRSAASTCSATMTRKCEGVPRLPNTTAPSCAHAAGVSSRAGAHPGRARAGPNGAPGTRAAPGGTPTLPSRCYASRQR